MAENNIQLNEQEEEKTELCFSKLLPTTWQLARMVDDLALVSHPNQMDTCTLATLRPLLHGLRGG